MQNNLFQWGSDVWLSLDQWGILVGLITGLVNLLAILIAFFKRDSLRRWFIRNRFPNVGELSLDSSLDGLIFTISHCEVPLWMIRNNQPKAIGLIASSASLANAKIIKDEAEKSGVQVLPICEVFNADNPVETMNNTQQLISTMRSNNLLQLGVDITGGKVPMSMGAFMAAEEAQVTTLYVSTDYNQALKKPDVRSSNIITVSRPV